jgi:hypothetical protein
MINMLDKHHGLVAQSVKQGVRVAGHCRRFGISTVEAATR